MYASSLSMSDNDDNEICSCAKVKKLSPKKCVASLGEAELRGKRVLVRIDLEIPLGKNSGITYKTRAQAIVPTVNHLKRHGARTILASHIGWPKRNAPEYRLSQFVPMLSDVLGVEVKMANDCIGDKVETLVDEMKEGEVLLLENVRFHKEEAQGDVVFAGKLASFADLFVNDAFETAHTAHASTALVAFRLKPAVAGFLVQKELEYLVETLENPEKKTFAAIVGGTKLSSKIDLIKSLLDKVGLLLLGGGLIFTFYKAQGYSVGSSHVEDDKLDLVRSLLAKAEEKGVRILLPSHVVMADEFYADATREERAYKEIPSDDRIGLDIGIKSMDSFGKALDSAKTIIWNGPMGVFEYDKFAVGTKAIAKKLSELTEKGAKTIIVGGDTVAAVEKFGLASKMSHISRGGAASLELLKGEEMPGLVDLDDA